MLLYSVYELLVNPPMIEELDPPTAADITGVDGVPMSNHYLRHGALEQTTR